MAGHRLFICVLTLVLLASCRTTPEAADLILHGGKIVTLDETVAECEAIAVRGDRILALGSNASIESHRGPSTEVIDLEGKLAIPGFIEGHGHFLSVGQARMTLNLTRVQSWGEIVAIVSEAASRARPEEWILGRGWHQEKWDTVPESAVEGLPDHRALSAVSPRNPVYLTHASGHASLVNARTMELAGIDRNTPDPPGGEIVRDARGEPIGVLRETASDLVRRALQEAQARRSPEEIEADLIRQVELAGRESLAYGVTTFHDAGSSFQTLDLLRRLASEGRLDVRLWVMVRDGLDELREKLEAYRTIGYGDDRLTVRAIKLSLDGALGTHGAWLLEPYSDLPRSTGLNTLPLEHLRETARLAIQHDFQLCVHAIGDRANREVLDLFEEVFREYPDKADLRWRVEHAQHLHPLDIPRFGHLGVIASMQGNHCTSDAPWVLQRLGAGRAEEGAYVWRKLMETGALVTNGTDAPVEDLNPIGSFYASVSRRLEDGRVFFPEQRMTRMQALRSYTWNNASAAFEEHLKGSLSVGKLADIVVLSQDLLTIPEHEIPHTQVVYTILGGKVVYRLDESGF